MKRILLFSVVIFALILAGCNSAPANNAAPTGVQSGPTLSENNVGTSALARTVIDWSNRTLGEQVLPAWVKGVVVNKNKSAVISQFSLQGDVEVRYGTAVRANRDEARVNADLMFAQQIANELKMEVMAGQAGNLDQGTLDLVESITSTTKVTLTGARKLDDFWQLTEIDDNGLKRREYIWWSIYAFDSDSWSQVVAKYLFDVVGQIPDTRVQQQLASAFDEINRQTRRNEERSDAEFQNEIDTYNRQMTYLHQENLASINQTAAVNVADANARRAAYLTRNPAIVAAASLTPADNDWVSALAAFAGIR